MDWCGSSDYLNGSGQQFLKSEWFEYDRSRGTSVTFLFDQSKQSVTINI